MDATAESVELRQQRLKLRRRLAFNRAVAGRIDEVVVYLSDLVADLTERVREHTAKTGPAPRASDADASPEEWAAWADKNLAPEDAEFFHRRVERGAVESAAD